MKWLWVVSCYDVVSHRNYSEYIWVICPHFFTGKFGQFLARSRLTAAEGSACNYTGTAIVLACASGDNLSTTTSCVPLHTLCDLHQPCRQVMPAIIRWIPSLPTFTFKKPRWANGHCKSRCTLLFHLCSEPALGHRKSRKIRVALSFSGDSKGSLRVEVQQDLPEPCPASPLLLGFIGVHPF